MKKLTGSEIACVSAGMSDTAKICVESGAMGALAGGIIGGVLVLPFYYKVLNQQGVSSSHQIFSFILMGFGVALGALAGTLIGSGSGFISSCQTSVD